MSTSDRPISRQVLAARQAAADAVRPSIDDVVAYAEANDLGPGYLIEWGALNGADAAVRSVAANTLEAFE